MPKVTVESIDYHVDTAGLFSRFLDLNNPILFDSAAPWCNRGRYDIFMAEPLFDIRESLYKTARYENNLNHFEELQRLLAEYLPALSNHQQLPFVGGAAGFWGYPSTDKANGSSAPDIPDCSIGLYGWAVIVDHLKQQSVLVAHPCVQSGVLKEVRSIDVSHS